MAHTPGPWWVIDADILPGIRGKGIMGTRGTLNITVAAVHSTFSDVERDNARLISSAPLMYAALKAVEWVEDEDGWRWCPWCKNAETYGHYQNCQRQAALDTAEDKEGKESTHG